VAVAEAIVVKYCWIAVVDGGMKGAPGLPVALDCVPSCVPRTTVVIPEAPAPADGTS